MRHLSIPFLRFLCGFLPKRNHRMLAQCGALCWRENDGRREILLITSREAGRWIIPKGWPMDGKTLAEAAAQEAWEEAGVRGTANPVSIGRYHYVKRAGSASAAEMEVTVFSLEVRQEKEDFPEQGQRDKMWLPPKNAAKTVDNPSLRKLIASFV